jgi:hypothetical protein
LALDLFGHPQIIGVQKADPRTRGQLDAGVPGVGQPHVGLLMDANSRTEFTQPFHGPIGRAVVDHNHF